MARCYWLGHSFNRIPEEKGPNGSRISYPVIQCKYCKESMDVERYQTFEDAEKDYKFRWTYWSSDNWEYFAKPLLIVLAVMLLVIAVIIFLSAGSSYLACKNLAEFDVVTRYNFWTGCMAYSEKTGWLPSEEFFKTINLYTK